MSPDKHITITIGGKTYPMIIKSEEEALVRKVEKEIQQSILDFQKAYTGLTLQDCMAMAMMTQGVNLQKSKEENDETQEYLQKWSQLLPAV